MPPNTTPTTDPLAGLGLSSTPPAGTGTQTAVGSLPKTYKQPTQRPPAPSSSIDIAPESLYGTAPTAKGTPGTFTTPGGTFYADGQEWAPLNDPATVPTLQAELVQAGLLNKANVRVGVWDADSAAAYKAALAFANASGLQISDALGVLIQNQKLGSTTAGTGTSAPGPYTLTNPADTQAAFRTAAENLTGMDLPQSEEAKFQQYFQSQERGAYQALGAATTAGTLTTTAPPSPTDAAQAYIRANDPNSVMAYGMASRANEFQQLLGSATGL